MNPSLSAAGMPAVPRNWSLGRVMTTLLLSGYLFLAIEIRYEHRDVVHRHHNAWIPWTPIVFSLLAVLAGIPGVLLWNSALRNVLQAIFAISLVVGAMGVWFHTHGHPFEALEVLQAWYRSPDQINENLSSPPALAPLAFCGIGLFGFVANLKRWDTR